MSTPQGVAEHRVHLVGAHPILSYFLGQMELVRIARDCLGTSRKDLLDHGQTLSILIRNILLSPGPLYRVSEWAAPLNAAALGITRAQKRSLNDDRVARTLDRLASRRGRNLFFRLALRIIKCFELDMRRVHHDTTTVTLQGQYLRSVSDPQITHGMSKDHRPDLKQLVFGLNVTADGAVPISHEVYSGNRTDDTVHQGNLEKLRHLLGRDDFIYVADSKLCTGRNLGYIAGYGGKFVTVMPRTRGEDKRFRQRLRNGRPVRWRKMHETANKRRKDDPPDIYSTTADAAKTSKERFRIVWCKSSEKARFDLKVRETRLRKAEVELFALGTRLNRGKLTRRPVIRSAIKAILASHKCSRFLKARVGFTVEIQIKHQRRGRPRKGAPVKKIRKRVYHIQTVRDADALRAEARTDGVFPLLTNLDARKYPKREVLLIYKYQPYIEKRHALMKTELQVAPVYLKKPRRVVGLIHAMFLAMTLDALIERSLRMGMKTQHIEKIPVLPEGRMSRTPTTARLLEVFSNVSWYEFKRGGETVTFPIELTKLHKSLLRLLEMDPSAYA